jgi:hypothetical protein
MSDAGTQQAFGDTGAWLWQVPWAWQRLADPRFPAAPRARIAPGARGDKLMSRVAHWAPLFHVLLFGLGWADPARGLSQWFAAGRQPQGSVPTFVGQHWGPKASGVHDDLTGFAAWFEQSDLVRQAFKSRFDALPGARSLGALSENWTLRGLHDSVQSDPTSQYFWAGSDPLHLSDHVMTPIAYSWFDLTPATATTYRTEGRDGTPRFILELDGYVGWYQALFDRPAVRDSAPTVPVDVYVKPVGWLGTYRRSSVTGLWYRGSHEVHLLGNVRN